MSRNLGFNFAGFAGGEFWKNWLPYTWQAKSVAKKVIRSVYKDLDLSTTPLYINMIDASYRVSLDPTGRLRVEKSGDASAAAIKRAGR